MQIIQPVTCPTGWILMARGHLGFPQTISYNGHQINRLKTQHTTTTLFFFFCFRRRSVGKVTPPAWSTLLVLHSPEPTAVAPVSGAVGSYTQRCPWRQPTARVESSLTPRTGGCCCNSSCRRAGCTGSGRSGRCSSCAAALTRVRKAQSRWPGASPVLGC